MKRNKYKLLIEISLRGDFLKMEVFYIHRVKGKQVRIAYLC